MLNKLLTKTKTKINRDFLFQDRYLTIIKSFLGLSDISKFDILSKNISRHEYRHHLVMYYIKYMLNTSDIFSIYQYIKIKEFLVKTHLVDYYIYIMAKIPWINDKICSIIDRSHIYSLFNQNLNEEKTYYNIRIIFNELTKILSHIAHLLSKRKIILLNIYCTQFPDDFNKQYNIECTYPNCGGFLLHTFYNLMPAQLIKNEYVYNKLFIFDKYNVISYLHFPKNNTYITLVRSNIIIMNKNLEKIMLTHAFNKLK
jgi:hypothetical protein